MKRPAKPNVLASMKAGATLAIDFVMKRMFELGRDPKVYCYEQALKIIKKEARARRIATEKHMKYIVKLSKRS